MTPWPNFVIALWAAEAGPPPHQETNEEGPAMTQPVIEQRRGSAAVALRRLAHPGRDGGAVVGDNPVSEPINPRRAPGREESAMTDQTVTATARWEMPANVTLCGVSERPTQTCSDCGASAASCPRSNAGISILRPSVPWLPGCRHRPLPNPCTGLLPGHP